MPTDQPTLSSETTKDDSLACIAPLFLLISVLTPVCMEKMTKTQTPENKIFEV